eukprot:5792633-Pyramimonas_sp.AAC.1
MVPAEGQMHTSERCQAQGKGSRAPGATRSATHGAAWLGRARPRPRPPCAHVSRCPVATPARACAEA